MPSRIGDALHWYATYTPNSIAIVSSAGTQSYAQLWSRVCRLSSALAELGLAPGDRIALLMQNSSSYLEVYQAAALMGAAVVPLNFRFTASEIEYVVNHSGARALLFDDSFVETVQSLRTRLPSVAGRYVVIDGSADHTTHSYEALIAAGRERRPPRRPISPLATSRAIHPVRRAFRRAASIHTESLPTACAGLQRSTA